MGTEPIKPYDFNDHSMPWGALWDYSWRRAAPLMGLAALIAWVYHPNMAWREVLWIFLTAWLVLSILPCIPCAVSAYWLNRDRRRP